MTIMDEEPEEISSEDIEAILEKFVSLGMATKVILENGEVEYQVTDIGIAVYESQNAVKN